MKRIFRRKKKKSRKTIDEVLSDNKNNKLIAKEIRRQTRHLKKSVANIVNEKFDDEINKKKKIIYNDIVELKKNTIKNMSRIIETHEPDINDNEISVDEIINNANNENIFKDINSTMDSLLTVLHEYSEKMSKEIDGVNNEINTLQIRKNKLVEEINEEIYTLYQKKKLIINEFNQSTRDMEKIYKAKY